MGMTTHHLKGCTAAVQAKDGKIIVAGYAMGAQSQGSKNDVVVDRVTQDCML